MKYRCANLPPLSLLFSLITGEMVIEIEDVNDNAPQFASSDSVFGEFISDTLSTFLSKAVLEWDFFLCLFGR